MDMATGPGTSAYGCSKVREEAVAVNITRESWAAADAVLMEVVAEVEYDRTCGEAIGSRVRSMHEKEHKHRAKMERLRRWANRNDSLIFLGVLLATEAFAVWFILRYIA
jgi:hypothetical protein